MQNAHTIIDTLTIDVKFVFSSILQHANDMADTIASIPNRLACMKAYSAVVVDDDVCKTHTHTSRIECILYDDDSCNARVMLIYTVQFSQCGSVYNV
jgi:hypothetical protein